jgi:hypothetical protein
VTALRILIAKWRATELCAAAEGLYQAADELEALLATGKPIELSDDNGRVWEGWAQPSDNNPTRH